MEGVECQQEAKNVETAKVKIWATNLILSQRHTRNNVLSFGIVQNKVLKQ